MDRTGNRLSFRSVSVVHGIPETTFPFDPGTATIPEPIGFRSWNGNHPSAYRISILERQVGQLKVDGLGIFEISSTD